MNPTANNTSEALNKIPDLLGKATSGIIVLPANPSQDAISAATALYLGLSKLGKTVSLVCSTTPQSDLVGADKIQNSLATGGDTLVISIPYSDGSINKVDYSQTTGFFNLIVEPKPGTTLDPKKVQFSHTGGKIEFIFTIDAPNLNSLGQIYTENQNEFNGKTIINVDRHLINDNFGVVNYVVKTSSSTSELVHKVLEVLKAEVDKDMATNLYAGLAGATNNFTSYSVNADTFEIASKLLKAGALKKPMRSPAPMGGGMGMGGGFPSPYAPMGGGMGGFPAPAPMGGGMGMGMPAPMPMRNPAPQPYQPQMPQANPFANRPPARAPMPMMGGQENLKPIEDIEDEPELTDDDSGAPQDWLKPKIFRGSGGLI